MKRIRFSHKMAEINEAKAVRIADASTIPEEMIPLLEEIEGHEKTNAIVNITAPFEENNEDMEQMQSEGIEEDEGPTTSKEKTPLQKLKLNSSNKSKTKRKKMEIFVRDCKHFVYIGDEYKRWDQYRKELRIKNDTEFAKILLDGFRKYAKVVQLVIGPSFGYSESFTGEDGKESLNPLNTGQRDDLSDSDDLSDYIIAVQEGVAATERDNATKEGTDGQKQDQATGQRSEEEEGQGDGNKALTKS